jgi:hypothetical protein
MIRDKISNALINNDVETLNKYKLEKLKLRKLEELTKEMTSIKASLTSISFRIEKIEKERGI